MKDPIEYFYPSKYYRDLPRTITNYWINDDLIAAQNRSTMPFNTFFSGTNGI
jgi:hypothetical protein